MTRREFFEMVIANVENEEMVNFARAEIEKMNTRNVNRAKTPSKKAVENEPIKEKIAEFLTEKEPTLAISLAKVGSFSVKNSAIKEKIAEFLTEKEPTLASEIAHELELKVQKVSALCRQMVENGVLTVTEVKVKNKGKQKAYALA